MIDFKSIKESELPNFRGGEGSLLTRCFVGKTIRIAETTLKKGVSMGFHAHDSSCEIIYVISGIATCTIDGREEIVSAGECHYCPKGSDHSIKNEHDEDLVIFDVVDGQ